MNDFINAVKAQLYDRASSPLFGSFAIAWVGWNHKFILVIFSNISLWEKFYFLETYAYPSPNEAILHGLIFPLGSAIIFLLVYPYPAYWIYQYWYERKVKLKALQLRIEGETPLSHEEARELRQAGFLRNMEFDKQLKAKDEEIAALRSLIESSNINLPPPLESSTKSAHPQSTVDIIPGEISSVTSFEDNSEIIKLKQSPKPTIEDLENNILLNISNGLPYTLKYILNVNAEPDLIRQAVINLEKMECIVRKASSRPGENEQLAYSITSLGKERLAAWVAYERIRAKSL